ncbi:site-specific DNA-methyltransferase [Ancylobacter sp. Lp-2]|uniref:site-specific DNA-methyltransferase n=1 Tax=Ancylobacter sp. Lp-2 TaxID=2881339 RepID=UPI001E38FEFB|nr:DNA methyltransferase [Ancylobacter sp. Lp-2]MCB4767116.1 site-specific DNA-methyltransferase [Ancylobacter sp. Lp-2]
MRIDADYRPRLTVARGYGLRLFVYSQQHVLQGICGLPPIGTLQRGDVHEFIHAEVNPCPGFATMSCSDVEGLPTSNNLYNDLQLTIETVSIGSVKSYTRNARTHSNAQIEQIKRSIESFGFVIPLTIEDDGTLLAGHGRLEAAKSAGRTTVPVVRISHLNEAQKRALRLADNKIAEQAGWDETLLALEFKDLLEIDLSLDLSFDLSVTGFASAEIDRLVETISDTGGAVEQDEEIPETSADPVSRLGDVFVLGDHRIICADAREAATYEALLDGERAAMSISDAPYNVSITQHVGSRRHGEFPMAVGEMDAAAFVRFLTSFLAMCKAFCREGGLHFACMDWRHMGEMLAAGGEAGLELKNLCIWDKGAGAMGSLYRSQHELVFVFKEPGAGHINNVQLGKFGRNRTNVWAYPGATSLRKELELHPTPKPVALVADAIRDASNRNDIVLDAFSGSGTTIIAAAKTGRRARVIELDPHYVDVAILRWEQWSGGTARHLATNMTFAELAHARQAMPHPESITEVAPEKHIRRRIPASLGSE